MVMKFKTFLKNFGNQMIEKLSKKCKTAVYVTIIYSLIIFP